MLSLMGFAIWERQNGAFCNSVVCGLFWANNLYAFTGYFSLLVANIFGWKALILQLSKFSCFSSSFIEFNEFPSFPWIYSNTPLPLYSFTLLDPLKSKPFVIVYRTKFCNCSPPENPNFLVSHNKFSSAVWSGSAFLLADFFANIFLALSSLKTIVFSTIWTRGLYQCRIWSLVAQVFF